MGVTTEGKYHLQLLHKPAHDKRLAESLLCMRRSVGLIACEVGDILSIYIFPSLRSHLSSLPIAHFLEIVFVDRSRTLQAT